MTSFSHWRALAALPIALTLAAVPAGAQPGSPGDVLEELLPGTAQPEDAPSEGSAAPTGAPNVTMRGSGWGHSVGMSQFGARAQAQSGRSAPQILGHYYPGATVGTPGSVDPGTVVRVELLAGRVAGEDARELRLAARGRDGATAPTTAATVRMGSSSDERPLPPPEEAWTLAHDGESFVLRDGAGTELDRGAGPVRLGIAAPGGANPGLLCLPQRGCAANDLAGTFQWGHANVTWDRDDERMRPILHVPIERYLRGLAEVPSSWEAQALQAQAIAGRTYASRRLESSAPWHLDTTPGTQAYSGYAKEGGSGGGNWVAAVDATSRLVVTYGGRLAQTYYSSSHGGRTENVQDSWAFNTSTTDHPYLRSVDDPWSNGADNPYAAWSATVSNAEFARAVREETGIARVAGVRVRDRTQGGTPRTLDVHGWDADGQRVTRAFTGPKNAGATLRLRWPKRDGEPFLRSQQITTFSVSPFADDDGSLHEYNIWVIAERGITKGCDAGDTARYCPSAPVTRGQMATFLARALDLRIDPDEPDRFSDTAGNPHRAAINAIAREGITGGCDPQGTRFCSANAVTRDQMASFLTRGFALPAGADAGFADVPANSPHRDAINAVAARGITAGCAEGRYCPRDPVTRGQMASFVARALGEGW